jgi:hypothetical protein
MWRSRGQYIANGFFRSCESAMLSPRAKVGATPNMYRIWYGIGDDKGARQQTQIYTHGTHWLDFTVTYYFCHRTFGLRCLPINLFWGGCFNQHGLQMNGYNENNQMFSEWLKPISTAQFINPFHQQYPFRLLRQNRDVAWTFASVFVKLGVQIYCHLIGVHHKSLVRNTNTVASQIVVVMPLILLECVNRYHATWGNIIGLL